MTHDQGFSRHPRTVLLSQKSWPIHFWESLVSTYLSYIYGGSAENALGCLLAEVISKVGQHIHPRLGWTIVGISKLLPLPPLPHTKVFLYFCHAQ